MSNAHVYEYINQNFTNSIWLMGKSKQKVIVVQDQGLTMSATVIALFPSGNSLKNCSHTKYVNIFLYIKNFKCCFWLMGN